MKSDITIRMCVRRTSRPEPEYYDFTPEEFFDRSYFDESDEDYSADDPLDVDSVPKYLDDRDYFTENDNIYYIECTVYNPRNTRKRHSELNYYDEQRSQFSIVTEYLGDKIRDRELVTDMRIPSKEENAVCAHDISRFHQKNGAGEYKCIDHCIITDYRDNTQDAIELPHQRI